VVAAARAELVAIYTRCAPLPHVHAACVPRCISSLVHRITPFCPGAPDHVGGCMMGCDGGVNSVQPERLSRGGVHIDRMLRKFAGVEMELVAEIRAKAERGELGAD
jgi:hypothetical protein